MANSEVAAALSCSPNRRCIRYRAIFVTTAHWRDEVAFVTIFNRQDQCTRNAIMFLKRIIDTNMVNFIYIYIFGIKYLLLFPSYVIMLTCLARP